MKLRRKITITFSVVFLTVMGIALGSIYYFSASYRKQEFYQRLQDRTLTTFKLLIEVREIDHDILQVLDRNTINSLYDEKILLFNAQGKVIYNSVDDTPIPFPKNILVTLEHKDDEIEYEDGDYEIFAHRFYDNGKTYYGIIKAKDKYGKSKLTFLGWLLGGIYLVIITIVILLTRYVSKQITDPISILSVEIEKISLDTLETHSLSLPKSKDEIEILALKFQEMLQRIQKATEFQRKFIQHLSHELKTPIAVLISHIEHSIKDNQNLQELLEYQKNGLMQIANIINTLLKIAKYQENITSIKKSVQIDELLFECFDELSTLYEKAQFDFSVDSSIQDTNQMIMQGDPTMLKIAFYNLLKNALDYSPNQKGFVEVIQEDKFLKIKFCNSGKTLSQREQEVLFQYFFRGENSRGISGMGLGLTIVQRILQIHQGSIEYQIQEKEPENIMIVKFDLN